MYTLQHHAISLALAFPREEDNVLNVHFQGPVTNRTLINRSYFSEVICNETLRKGGARFNASE